MSENMPNEEVHIQIKEWKKYAGGPLIRILENIVKRLEMLETAGANNSHLCGCEAVSDPTPVGVDQDYLEILAEMIECAGFKACSQSAASRLRPTEFNHDDFRAYCNTLAKEVIQKRCLVGMAITSAATAVANNGPPLTLSSDNVEETNVVEAASLPVEEASLEEIPSDLLDTFLPPINAERVRHGLAILSSLINRLLCFPDQTHMLDLDVYAAKRALQCVVMLLRQGDRTA